MKEVGIDIMSHRSKHVDEFAGQNFDYVLTVCDNAKESCLVFFGRPLGCITVSPGADELRSYLKTSAKL